MVAAWLEIDGVVAAARLLAMFDDGDPAVWDAYAGSPLSGEWADDSSMTRPDRRRRADARLHGHRRWDAGQRGSARRDRDPYEDARAEGWEAELCRRYLIDGREVS